MIVKLCDVYALIQATVASSQGCRAQARQRPTGLGDKEVAYGFELLTFLYQNIGAALRCCQVSGARQRAEQRAFVTRRIECTVVRHAHTVVAKITPNTFTSENHT